MRARPPGDREGMTPIGKVFPASLLESQRRGLCSPLHCRVLCLAALLFPFPVTTFGYQLTASEIVKRSIATTQADWNANSHFSYVEQDVNVRNGATTSKTYRVMMLDGSPYSCLLAINGEPLPPQQAVEERYKVQQEIAMRSNESAESREKRLAEYRKDRSRSLALIDEMAEAFDFQLLREEKLDGHNVFVISAIPRPSYQPSSWKTSVMKGMNGTLWVDQQSYQWVKVEAVAFRPVRLGWLIAKVLPGTRFLLEQTPVAPGLWLPKHFSLEARTNVLFWQKDYKHSESYRDYRPVGGQPNPQANGRTACANLLSSRQVKSQ